jgi:O-antigen ligase
MQGTRDPSEYEPVEPSRAPRAAEWWEQDEAGGGLLHLETEVRPSGNSRDHEILNPKTGSSAQPPKSDAGSIALPEEKWLVRRGHAISFACLFLFTVVLYARPSDYYPSPLTNSIAFVLGLLTLCVFVLSQLMTEGNLTARPREVHLVLLLCLAGLLSIPFAKVSRIDAWATFSNTFIRAIVMFIVMVNVVRTERRLKALLALAIGIGCVLSADALNNYRLGDFAVEGYRVSVMINGMFGNPNDMAIHLVMMIPICIGLMFAAGGIVRKAIYVACAVLMVAGTVVTFSRGGFLALVAASMTLALKIGRRHRLAVVIVAILSFTTFIAFAPGNYSNRVLSIFVHQRDAFGSADARQALLLRSLHVALRNPVFGIGMGNFNFVSIRDQESHNAYTQVWSEMGLAALIVYVMFLLTPLKRLRQIERETLAEHGGSHFYYIAIGLQASLVAYMVASFFASVAYYWNIYYLVGYAVCLRRIYVSSRAAPKTIVKGEAGQGPITTRPVAKSSIASTGEGAVLSR